MTLKDDAGVGIRVVVYGRNRCISKYILKKEFSLSQSEMRDALKVFLK